MSSYGIGQGVERGVGMVTDMFIRGMQMKQQDKYIEQQREMHLDRLAVQQGWQMGQNEWNRGPSGLGPSYEDAEQAAQLTATRPRIPSSQPIETPGKLGIPLSRFEVGQASTPAPRPSPAAKPPMVSPAALLASPPFMRRPRMRTGY
ncbi:hypothetical protein [Nitrospira lenta]|uniref:Uncharacterized protein n=1 Tax=Nitrospira lenta TaxID=1436998 RepID=A0A330L5X3_9BACT|nr:hypothetical protein [Nitrospira lenta]SPP64740.1 hypothetical protein NITLEN_20380 [Nitrospira lenta]